jgi:hypothetical protein
MSSTTYTRKRADATITVHSLQATDTEIQVVETFTGDIDGESTARAMKIVHQDKSASLASVHRFQGTVGGRRGSFLMLGQEIVKDGQIKATWFVVSGSGTGDLAGLRGEGGFEGEFGKGSHGTLDYWFE